MIGTVFVGISLDGFLARPDGALDFLPTDTGESYGFEELLASVDALVMGRKTFETALGFGEWPYRNQRVVVLSSRTLDLSTLPVDARVEQLSGDPADVAQRLAASGVRHAYIDGGETIRRFLRAGLVHRLVLTRVPILIGQGVPLFGPLDRDIRLQHVKTNAFASGLVQSEYTVAPS